MSGINQRTKGATMKPEYQLLILLCISPILISSIYHLGVYKIELKKRPIQETFDKFIQYTRQEIKFERLKVVARVEPEYGMREDEYKYYISSVKAKALNRMAQDLKPYIKSTLTTNRVWEPFDLLELELLVGVNK